MAIGCSGSFSKKAKARISTDSRSGALGGVFGSTNPVCGVNLALQESKDP